MSWINDSFTTDPVSYSARSGDSIITIMGRIYRAAEKDGGYQMNLNPADAKLLVEALNCAVENTGDPDFGDAVQDLLSSIATTLNVELI